MFNQDSEHLFDDTDLLDFLILLRLGGGISGQLYTGFLKTREIVANAGDLSEHDVDYYVKQYNDMRELLIYDKYLYDNFYYSEYLGKPGEELANFNLNPIKIMRSTGAKQVLHVTAHELNTQNVVTFIIGPEHVTNLKLLKTGIIRTGDFTIKAQGKHHHTNIKITRIVLSSILN